MIFLDRDYILNYIDARLTKMGFCKKSGFYLLWRGPTVTTLWVELYGPQKRCIEYRIGKFSIWDDVRPYEAANAWKFLKEGSIRFSIELYTTYSRHTYYQIAKTIHLDPHRFQNTRINMLYGSQASLQDYIQILDEGLFPFLAFISTWSGYKLSCKSYGPIFRLDFALYDRDIEGLKGLRQQVFEAFCRYGASPEQKEEELKVYDTFLGRMERGEWGKIDAYLNEQAAPMTTLLTKKKIPDNGLVSGSYTEEQFEGIVQTLPGAKQ